MLLYQKKPNKNIKHIHNTLPLEDWNPYIKDRYCFYYNWCDQVYDIEFLDCLQKEHIEFLKINSHIKCIYDFNGEPILESIIDNIIDIANRWQLNSGQLIVTVNNQLQEEFIKRRLEHFNSDKIKILQYNFDIKNMIMSDPRTVTVNKKFSAMARLHRPWRSYIMCRLKEQGLLSDFHYSFVGCENDMGDAIAKSQKDNLDITVVLTTGDWKIIRVTDKIKHDLSAVCNYTVSKEINDFIEQCPHYIEKEYFKSDAETPRELFASDIHLIIENGFFDLKESAYTRRSFEMGEKTWKPISAAKPFLVYSDQGYLENLRYIGFKTFSPYINESYDKEENPKLRAEQIIQEIERINRLSPTDYLTLLNNCKEIAEHNYKLYNKIKEQTPEFLSIEFDKL